MTPYCPITHLAMTLCPTESWPRHLMAFFTACFDGSGNEDEHDYVIVAGFVSSSKDWIGFSKQWKKVLEAEKIEYFRASELQSYEGEFKSWKALDEKEKHKKRTRLWCDLLDIIEPSVYRKFGCGIRIPEYISRLSAENILKARLNAYAMCAYVCGEAVRQWARENHLCNPVDIVFEEGDKGWGLLEDLFKVGNLPPPIQRPKKNRLREGICYPAYLPLQAADFLAHETFTAHKLVSLNRPASIARPLARFHEMKGTITRFSDHGLDLLNDELSRKPPVLIDGIWQRPKE